jgi:phosphatidylglycerol:prolipoprotein diacylglycerol transferase
VYPVLFHIGSILIPAYGALAALGVLLALFLAQRTAQITGLNSGHIWSLCVIALFAALAGQRLLLVVLNWNDLRRHPLWMFELTVIHHPLLAATGAAAGICAALWYARRKRLPLSTTADALAAPLALGLACEQLGALLAGSGYGTETNVGWAVTYTNPLSARWSGTPLGIPLHPVQGYAALAFLTLSVLLVVWLPVRRQQGDVAGTLLLGMGAVIYMTELWRDPLGRGALLNGILDGPQTAAIVMVVSGGLLLRLRNSSSKGQSTASSLTNGEKAGHWTHERPGMKGDNSNG